MSKKFLMGSLTALLILQAPVAGLANGGDPTQAAEQAIIDGRQVDLRQLQQFGADYLRNYLTAYHRASINYRQAYQMGLNDAHGHRYCPPTNLVGQTAYQRGWQTGQDISHHDLQASTTPDSQRSASEGSTAIDQNNYPLRQPLPNQAKFIQQIAQLAQEVGHNYDLYPSVIIAQAALESNWGSSDLSRAPYWNLFGVKGQYQGRSVLKPTTEFLNGREQKLADHFRTYPSMRESLVDYAKTLQDPLYDQVHRSHCHHYREATHALVGKYATDPAYEQKLNQLIDQYQLTKYDHWKAEGSGNHRADRKPNHQWTTPHLADDQHANQATDNEPHKVSPVISVIGGAGTAGLFEAIRRFIMK